MAQAQEPEHRFRGRCIEWRRGAGIIRPDMGQVLRSPVLAHQSEVQRAGLRLLQVGEEVTFSLGRNPNGRVVAQRIADAQDNPLPEVVKQQEDPEQSSVVGKKRKEAGGHGQPQGGNEKQKQTRVALEDELPWLVLSSESSSSALSASAAEPDKDGDDSANDTTMIGQDQQSPMDKGEAGGESRDRDGSGDTVGAVLKRMVEGFRGNLQRWLSGQRLRAHLQQTLVQGELQQLRPRLRTILETHADLLPGNRGSSSPAVETALQVSLLNALAELHCSIKRDLVASLHTLRSMASNPVGGQQQQQQGGSNQAKRQKQSAPEAQPPEDGLKDPADILVEILRQCPAGIKTNDLAKLYQRRTGESFAKTGQKLNHVLNETPAKFQKAGKLWKAAP